MPLVLSQPAGFRPAISRALSGQPALNINEAALQDSIDLIPIVGDLPNIVKILTNKGNRINQLQDAAIGVIPIAGDIADFFFASDTNIQQIESNSVEKKGKVETFVTLSFVPNAIEKYIGGVERNIWYD